MPAYVALLRAINVGGTGKLPMAELRKLCEDCGFSKVATYIQSGNVVFSSKLSAARVKKTLEQALAKKMGKPFGAMIRTAPEMRAVVEKNPFPKAPPNRVLVFFLDEAPPKDALKGIKIPGSEKLALGTREVFVHYPDGMGKSKLKLPFQKTGTGRNLNTVTKMLEMVSELA